MFVVFNIVIASSLLWRANAGWSEGQLCCASYEKPSWKLINRIVQQTISLNSGISLNRYPCVAGTCSITDICLGLDWHPLYTRTWLTINTPSLSETSCSDILLVLSIYTDSTDASMYSFSSQVQTCKQLYSTITYGTIIYGTIICGYIIYGTIICGTIIRLSTSTNQLAIIMHMNFAPPGLYSIIVGPNSIMFRGVPLFWMLQFSEWTVPHITSSYFLT